LFANIFFSHSPVETIPRRSRRVLTPLEKFERQKLGPVKQAVIEQQVGKKIKSKTLVKQMRREAVLRRWNKKKDQVSAKTEEN